MVNDWDTDEHTEVEVDGTEKTTGLIGGRLDRARALDIENCREV